MVDNLSIKTIKEKADQLEQVQHEIENDILQALAEIDRLHILSIKEALSIKP